MPSVVETPFASSISTLAGKPAPTEVLVDLARLEREYLERRPDLSDTNQMVRFGTSGHRGMLFAGVFVEARMRARGKNTPIGGLKVTTAHGWFAARPSGTENVYKIYAESFRSEAHLNSILSEAQTIVNNATNSPEGRA